MKRPQAFSRIALLASGLMVVAMTAQSCGPRVADSIPNANRTPDRTQAEEGDEMESPVESTGNGWSFIVEQDPQTLLAHLRIIIRSGSLSDPPGLPGLAHFTARALLRGTRTRPYKDLTSTIERLGASVSVSVDQTQTVIGASVIAKNLDPFLDVLRDVLTQPAFDVSEMVLLQGLIQGELRSRLQDVQNLAAAACTQKAYAGTGAAVFPGGTVSSVAKITPADADAFFRARYVRENMLVGVTSPFAADEVTAKIQTKFEPVVRGVLDAPALPAAGFQNRRAVIVPRDGMSTMPMYLVVPGVSDGDLELPTLEVGNFVFGADFTSRLMQELRAKNGWTYGAYSGFFQLVGPKAEAGLFSIYTFPSTGYAALTLAKTVEMLEAYVRDGVTQDEFEAARDALVNRYSFSLDTAEKRLSARIREKLNGRLFESVAGYRDRMLKLQTQSVNSAIERRTSADSMLICVVGDPATLKPALTGLPGMAGVDVVEIKP